LAGNGLKVLSGLSNFGNDFGDQTENPNEIENL